MAYDPAPRRERTIAAAIVVLLMLGVLLDERFPRIPLARVETAVPTVDGISLCAFALTAWMLVAQYRVKHYGPVAILGAAFAVMAVLQFADVVFYPAVLGAHIPFGNNQSQAWMRITGRISFDAIVIAYAVADWSERRSPLSSQKFVAPVWIVALGVVIVAVTAGSVGSARLPRVVDPGVGLEPLYERVLFPVMFSWTFFAGALVVTLGKRGSRLRAWLVVVLAAICGNLVTSTLGQVLFTSGFYVSRAYDLVGALTFVFVVQAQIVSILRRAQRTGERAHALSVIISLGDSQSYAGINAMLTRVAREFEYDYVALQRASNHEFVIEFSYGAPGFSAGYRTPMESSISRYAVETRALFMVEDFTEERWRGQRERTGGMWSSVCLVPIFTEEGLYGTIAFANSSERPQLPTSLERDFLGLVGVLAGNAIDRIRQKKRLDELAYYDALTGLPNRVLLVDRISTAVVSAERYGGRVAVHFLDLDAFKPINDRYGHAVGDEVLREVAHRLEHTVRQSDTVGRYGGDEFVVLQPLVASTGEVSDLAGRVNAAFRDPVVVAAGSFDMGISMGVSLYPDDGTDAHTLLLRADEAQYRVKDARRARSREPRS